jgi:Cation transport ATPase (P-type)
MSVVFHDLQTSKNEVFMKGAPEGVLEACIYNSEREQFTEDDRLEVVRLVEEFACEGLVGPSLLSTNRRKFLLLHSNLWATIARRLKMG